MKLFKRIILLVITVGLFQSCFSDFDDNSNSNVKGFIWKGMNAYYLYKDDIPDLANDRFASDLDYNEYLNAFSSPEELFANLKYVGDRFSFLVDDYIALEQALSGTTFSNGMEFQLRFVPGSSTDVFGYVRYVLPNTNAETQGVERGYIFNAVNNMPLYYNSNIDTNIGLLRSDNYTINLATYDNNGTPETEDDSVISGTESITLIKSPYTENPIFKTEIIPVNGNNVGYLMYNGFTGSDSFDSQLNNVFGNFASAGISDLVLDLRYNPGGSVRTATWLASMITGDYTNEVFIKEQWNSEIQAEIEATNPEYLINPFVDTMIKYDTSGSSTFQESINHVNLNRVYILTTESTASASELIINGLRPYIEVIQIGTTTTGKYQASITLYDSPDFNKQGANLSHTYALQPLIFKSLNANNVTDYDDGLSPTDQNLVLPENYGNLGILGDVNEPLLAAAIAHIEGSSRFSNYNIQILKQVGDSKMFSPTKNRMYSEKKLPIRY